MADEHDELHQQYLRDGVELDRVLKEDGLPYELTEDGSENPAYMAWFALPRLEQIKQFEKAIRRMNHEQLEPDYLRESALEFLEADLEALKEQEAKFWRLHAYVLAIQAAFDREHEVG